MSCISLSNDESLIYLLVSGEFRNGHFRHFGELKMRFLLKRQRVLLSQDLGYTCIGNRNICKYHFFLILNSDCWNSNTRIHNLLSCISVSNYDNLIYVLVS